MANQPTKPDFIPYARPLLDDADREAVAQVLHTPWLTQGSKVQEFEDALAGRCGTRHAVAVANGSAALHLAYAAIGIGLGDEILTSPITFAATASMAEVLGAKARFVDIRADTFTMDPEKLDAAITPNTKAIVPVDFSGHPCDIEAIRAVADARGIPVIIDAAHSFGATYFGRPTGGLAAMSTFSFHAIKSIAAGEGGAITTDDDALAERLRVLRSHGLVTSENEIETDWLAADNVPLDGGGPENQIGRSPWYYEVKEVGWNYRLTDIQCALALSQMSKLDTFLARRAEIASNYDVLLGNEPNIVLPARPDGCTSAWHLYVIRLRLDRLSRTRREIFESLRSNGIGVHVHYIPVHLQPYYRHANGTKWGDFPVAERYYSEALTLPLHPSMSDADVRRVADEVLAVVR